MLFSVSFTLVIMPLLNSVARSVEPATFENEFYTVHIMDASEQTFPPVIPSGKSAPVQPIQIQHSQESWYPPPPLVNYNNNHPTIANSIHHSLSPAHIQYSQPPTLQQNHYHQIQPIHYVIVPQKPINQNHFVHSQPLHEAVNPQQHHQQGCPYCRHQCPPCPNPPPQPIIIVTGNSKERIIERPVLVVPQIVQQPTKMESKSTEFITSRPAKPFRRSKTIKKPDWHENEKLAKIDQIEKWIRSLKESCQEEDAAPEDYD